MIDEIFFGEGQLLSAPFFANMYGADPSIAPRSFDPKVATTLLNEAGYPIKNGKRFSIDLITTQSQHLPIHGEMFAIFKHDLRAVGISLNIRYLTPDVFAKASSSGQYDAAFFGWIRDIPDPDPSALLHSTQAKGGDNYANYQNPQVDRWLEDSVTAANSEKRKAIYKKLHRQLYQDMPYTVLYAPFSHYAWSRKLQRVNPADVAAQTRFPGISTWRFQHPGTK